MGIILAKFRKEKTTVEILENLDTKIKDIESFSISTQERQKRFVGNFLVISIGLYVISSIIFFFAFFPSTWSKRIIYSAPLLIFPFLIILLKRLVAWYFQRKLNRNANQLKTLRAEKKKIIEQVMDKETYKVALDILNRFADTTTRLQHQQTGSIMGAPLHPSALSTPTKVVPKQASLTPFTQQRLQQMPMPQQRTPINARASPQVRTTNAPSLSGSPMHALGSPSFQQMQFQQQQRRWQPPPQMTPYPIINQSQKNLFEKVVDYLIGEGPSSRYGMICKECHGHNGMVSQEEYEYSAFKCAFCKALNPAKKMRPVAPRLPLPAIPLGGASATEPSTLQRSAIAARMEEPSSSTSASDKESSSESEPISGNEAMELIDNDEKSSENQQSTQATDDPIISQTAVDNDDKDRKYVEEIQSDAIADEATDAPKTDVEKKNE